MTQREATRFARLYEQFHRQIYAYCHRRSSFDAVDDLVADVFLAVWRKIGDAPDGDDSLRWLYRIAYLVTSNHWRSTSRRHALTEKLMSIGLQQVPLIQDQVVVREEVRQVLAAARNLRDRDVEVLRLSLWEHLSSDDIGTVLGITANAAKQRLHRARNNLVHEYEKMTKESVSPAAQKGGGQ